MEQYHLSDSEYRFLQVVWAAEPVGSGELVRLCAKGNRELLEVQKKVLGGTL